MEGQAMKVLIMGGTFNPIHIGHLILAEEARMEFAYDRVIMVPARNPPHKAILDDPGPDARLEMLIKACEDDDSLIVDDCELKREGTSYSIDTIRDIAMRYALKEKPGLLIGDDLMPGFPGWRNVDALAVECDLVCAHRSSESKITFPYPHRYLDNMLIPISSSMVRLRIAKGFAYRRLVPDRVWEIIETRGWYRAS